jgi:hypothetical protein
MRDVAMPLGISAGTIRYASPGKSGPRLFFPGKHSCRAGSATSLTQTPRDKAGQRGLSFGMRRNPGARGHLGHSSTARDDKFSATDQGSGRAPLHRVELTRVSVANVELRQHLTRPTEGRFHHVALTHNPEFSSFPFTRLIRCALSAIAKDWHIAASFLGKDLDRCKGLFPTAPLSRLQSTAPLPRARRSLADSACVPTSFDCADKVACRAARRRACVRNAKGGGELRAPIELALEARQHFSGLALNISKPTRPHPRGVPFDVCGLD